MSYALVVAEVRRSVFEDRNMDSIGLCSLLEKDTLLLVPDGDYTIKEQLLNSIIKAKVEESLFLNPTIMVDILVKIMETRGKPDLIVFTNSASGTELASYAAGYFNMPIITDVSAYDRERGIFYKSYYSDKIFGEFKPSGEGPLIVTVRSGSFKESICEKGYNPTVEIIEDVAADNSRTFIEFVEEEKSDVDITKAEFLF